VSETVRRVMRWEAGLLILIAIVTVSGAVLSPDFLTVFNLQTIALNVTVLGFLALGVAPVIMASDIDISITAILALCGVVMAVFWQNGMNIWLAALIAVALGAVLGLVNGLLVVLLELPSLAITLGTQGAYTGIAFLILQGKSIANFPQDLVTLGSSGIFNSVVPIASVVLLLFAAALAFVMHGTTFGKAVFAIGGNRQAARFSGIAVTRTRVLLFVISGIFSALGAVIYLGYYNSIQANSAQDVVLPAITVAILGGVSAYGGTGTIFGVVLAFILLGLLEGVMGVVGLSGQAQSIGIGILLIIAIAAGTVIRSTMTRLATRTRIRPPRGKEEPAVTVAVGQKSTNKHNS